MMRRVLLLLGVMMAVSLGAAHQARASSATAPTNIPFENGAANQPVLAPQTADPALQAVMPAEPVAVEHAAEGHKSKGLPQFDTTTYSKQIFWLFVAFVIMYVVFGRTVLPRLEAGLASRSSYISKLVMDASGMRDEAERLKMEYEVALDSARASAKTMLNTMLDDNRKESDAKMASFEDKARKAIEALESHLDTQKDQILKDAADMAASLAMDIAKKTAGVSLEGAAVKLIAGKMMKDETIARAA